MHCYVLTGPKLRHQPLNSPYEAICIARRPKVGNGHRDQLDSMSQTCRAFGLKAKLDIFAFAEQRYDDLNTLGSQRCDVIVEPVPASRPRRDREVAWRTDWDLEKSHVLLAFDRAG